ncbi:hypothetical protein [Flaviaesturariibacter amylovorans]|uniref:Phosphatidate cytidylyltransferase n=1 Tax=Flaviaesturariibacter amylovorans TaxID=1084520 RepID=A0ABP8HVI0_9BACT
MKVRRLDIAKSLLAGIGLGLFLLLFGYIGVFIAMVMALISVGLLISSIWLGRKAIIWGLAGLVPFLMLWAYIRL